MLMISSSFAVEFVRSCRAAVLDDDDIEAFIGEGSHRRGNALIGENPGADDMLDAEIMQDEAKIGAGQRRVRRLGDDDLVALRRQFGHELGRRIVHRQKADYSSPASSG